MSAAPAWTARLGQLGVWARVSDVDVPFAREAERLGYGTVWLGGSPAADLARAEQVLDGTESVVVATGIVNIWRDEAAELADAYHRIVARHPGRLVLGIGSGHREATPHRTKPLQAMADYLDVLDERGVPLEDRALSALGPRMLALAAERSGGTHPYLTVPSQTAEAREALGPGKLVAPEQTVVLDADVDAARRAARAFLRRYLQLTNYTGNMLRAGFSEADVAGEGSDELIDRIVVHGEATDLVRALRAHLDAGADHVCVQVQPGEDAPRALAEIAAAFAE
ncbi:MULTISPECIES: TIGR03620 family F420-dependent LLM class oxidoreductase [Microbacterium]|uniref:TIGR03620 family F420-dependent LLM class oxidoreductase n=1 Tax=Microbacterium wangchenii TaxID=2541726 RepID=A0ABX5SNM9_9MICO|nr:MULTISPECIES: TIGR03620 family F420-dependent LLM class oxidoreductase [Microbacterium]MCK6068130.1 TIGR03620 family F420-dependent LLM class oxidoreductase [Microbacterium sp. EYE_512]QBR87749.1 TIGR03620 family F420-dependent LLM class oxidoreductase [Microbacterium wangchenii]